MRRLADFFLKFSMDIAGIRQYNKGDWQDRSKQINRQEKGNVTMAINEQFDHLVTYNREELYAARSELVKEFGMSWAQFRDPEAYQKFLCGTEGKADTEQPQ